MGNTGNKPAPSIDEANTELACAKSADARREALKQLIRACHAELDLMTFRELEVNAAFYLHGAKP